ncbi:hypothetical protein [Alkalibacillus silvisoli]
MMDLFGKLKKMINSAAFILLSAAVLINLSGLLGFINGTIVYLTTTILVTLSIIVLFIYQRNTLNDVKKMKGKLKRMREGIYTDAVSFNRFSINQEIQDDLNGLSKDVQNSLHYVQDHALTIQKFSYLLKEDAEKTVHHLYDLSIEIADSAQGDLQAYEDFISSVHSHLQFQSEFSSDTTLIKYKLDKVKDLEKNRQSEVISITVTLSDLFETIEQQSRELSHISEELMKQIERFYKQPSK